MKNFSIAGYTIDSYFVIAAIGCFVLALILPRDNLFCALAGVVNIWLAVIDALIQNVKENE